MDAHVQIKLFATLAKFMPETPECYRIRPNATVGEILAQLGIPREKARLIFIDGLKADLETKLTGGERIGIFPPVGGG